MEVGKNREPVIGPAPAGCTTDAPDAILQRIDEDDLTSAVEISVLLEFDGLIIG